MMMMMIWRDDRDFSTLHPQGQSNGGDGNLIRHFLSWLNWLTLLVQGDSLPLKKSECGDDDDDMIWQTCGVHFLLKIYSRESLLPYGCSHWTFTQAY